MFFSFELFFIVIDKVILWSLTLMVMFCDIYYYRFFLVEEKVFCVGFCCDSNVEVFIVGYEDEYEEVVDDYLDDMQYSLQEVRKVQYLLFGE